MILRPLFCLGAHRQMGERGAGVWRCLPLMSPCLTPPGAPLHMLSRVPWGAPLDAQLLGGAVLLLHGQATRRFSWGVLMQERGQTPSARLWAGLCIHGFTGSSFLPHGGHHSRSPVETTETQQEARVCPRSGGVDAAVCPRPARTLPVLAILEPSPWPAAGGSVRLFQPGAPPSPPSHPPFLPLATWPVDDQLLRQQPEIRSRGTGGGDVSVRGAARSKREAT